MRFRPDVLVLGGGGVLGEAWMMGVLAGLEDGTGVDLRDCDAFVGTSAGAIVAAHLVAGRSPRRPSSLSTELELDAVTATRAGAVATLAGAAAGAVRRAGATAVTASAAFAPLALGAAAPGGALVRALLLRRLPEPRDNLAALADQVSASGARFDGRLRVAAVVRASGRRVVFGSPRAPRATVAEAVQASCTVPWLFAPVTIGGREYVAGRDTHVLCLSPTASLGSTGHALLGVMQGVARSAATVEALVLRRRGARVQTIAPNAASAAAMGANFMQYEPRPRVLTAGYRQGLALAAANR
jgi:NTE family protein